MLQFFMAALLVLAAAWLLGEALHRVGQPALVGQLIAGIIVGPSVLNYVQPTSELGFVENLSLFFIMLFAGLASKPSEVIAAGRRAILVSSISFIIPFAVALEASLAFGLGVVSSLVVGLTISITAVPVNAILLTELGLLNSKEGSTVIAAGIIDDVLAFTVISVIQQYADGGAGVNYVSLGVATAKVIVFLAAVLICERTIRKNSAEVRRIGREVGPKLQSPESAFAGVLIFAVAVSLLAQWVGLQFIIGTFFAGLLLGDLVGTGTLRKATKVLEGTTLGFFGPLAFGFIGIEFEVSTLYVVAVPLLVLFVIAITTKLLGGYVGAKLGGFNTSESLTIGFLMNSRGFVGLVIAETAYQMGLVDQTVFSVVMAIGILTTVISPIAARINIRRSNAGRGVFPRAEAEPRGLGADLSQDTDKAGDGSID